MNWMYILGLSAISAALYAIGGKGGFTNAKQIRRIGCSLITVATLWFIHWHWIILCCLPLIYIAYSNYWSFEEGTTELPKHFAWHGLGIALAVFPYVIATGLWLPFITRCIVLPVFFYYWSILSSWAPFEEGMRGFVANLSLAFFLISA